jgi:hypothetical protein
MVLLMALQVEVVVQVLLVEMPVLQVHRLLVA